MINNCKEIRVPIEIMNVRNLTITQKVLLSQIAENTKCIEKRIIKVNCPPYPIILKEGIKANNNIPIKTEFKDNNKYINNKNKYSYTNYEQRDYSNFDWNSLYAN